MSDRYEICMSLDDEDMLEGEIGVEQEVEGVEQEVEGVDQEVEGVEQEMEGVDQEVEGVEQEMEGAVGGFEEEANGEEAVEVEGEATMEATDDDDDDDEENLEGAVGFAPGYSGGEYERLSTRRSFDELGILQILGHGEEMFSASGTAYSPELQAQVARVLFADEPLSAEHYTEFAQRLTFYIRQLLENQLPRPLLLEIKQAVLKIKERFYVNTTTAEATEKDTNASCVICLTAYAIGDPLRYMRCRHYFHQACIDRWLREKPQCPLCRQHLVHLV